MKRAVIFVGLVSTVIASYGLPVRASLPQVPSNTWSATGDLVVGRAGASAVLLPDGRVLVTGGSNEGGVSASVERYSPNAGGFVATPPMENARANHSSTRLQDGRVLVVGGVGVDGHAVASAELYDPNANAWAPAAPLNHARSGHTATLLSDGRVLVAGGDDTGVADATLEVFDPFSSIFSPLDAVLSAPRTGHAAASLPDGRVLIAGGFDGTNALASVDVFDPTIMAVMAGPSLTTARAGHSATTLLDGKVLIAGGASDSSELASAEIFDPAANTFAPAGNMLAAARQRHVAMLLPHNNNVLIVGGTSAGNAVATAELYTPWEGDGGTFCATTVCGSGYAGPSAPNAARAWAIGAALSVPADETIRTGPADGLLLLAGGSATSSATAPTKSAELYGFATVRTDKVDYAPGTTVTITGSGWQPHEWVALMLKEYPEYDEHPLLDVEADDNGNIVSTEFVPDVHDLGIRFYLTASGSASQAQTTFTDARVISSATLNGGTAVTVMSSASITAQVTVVTDNGGGNNNWKSTGWRIATTPPGATTCVNHADHTSSNTFTETFSITAPSSAGVYNAYFIAYADDACSSGSSATFTLTNGVTVDSVAPGVSSINRATVNPTNASTISWTVIFSENVVGVNASDFALAATGVSGASITGVTGSNSTYAVTASTGTGDGTLGLNLVDDDSVADVAGNKLGGTGAGNGNVTGQVYTVDRTAPAVSSINRAAVSPTNAASVNWTVTFSKNVTGVDAADFALAAAGISGSSITGVAGSNNIYTVTASTGSGDGTLGLNLVDNDSIVDGAGNKLGGSGPGNGNFTGQVYTVDKTPPSVVSIARAIGSPTNAVSVSWTVTLSEDVTGVDAVDFALSSAGLGGTPAIGTVSAVNGHTYTVAASTGMGTGTLGLNLTDDDTIVDAAGNKLGGAGAGNGNFAGQSYSIDRTLTPQVTVANRSYDGTTAATITSRTFTSSLTVTENVSVGGGSATFDSKNAGTGKTATATGLALTGADAVKYVLSSTTATAAADVTPRDLTVTASGANKVYDAMTSATVTLATDKIGGDTVSATFTSATFADKHVGTAKAISVTGISISGVDAANYQLTNTTAGATGNITPRDLTVSATGVNKVYDATTTATLTLSNDRIAGDAVTAAYTSATFGDKHVGTAKAISVAGISISGADAGDYHLTNTTASASADITPVDLTVTATGVNKVYDTTTNATVTLETNKINGDAVTAAYTSATFGDKHVGTSKAISVVGVAISGGDAGNYHLTNTTASATADITPRDLTVTATGVNKVYNGTTSATVTLATNKIGGDDASASSTSASFADKQVGTAKTVSVTGISISGGDAGDYHLTNTTASATADITPRDLAVTATGVNKAYNGTASATVTLATDKVGGDDVSASSASASFADKQVGTAKTVSVTGLSISGGDAGNYHLTNTTATASADITPRDVTVTATGVNKIYDGTTVATVALATDKIGGDDVSASSTSTTFADKQVGTAKTVSVTGISISGGDGGNYHLTNSTANATADITPRDLTVTATGVNKVYNGTASATVTLATDKVGGDDVLASSASASFADKQVGTGKTVSVTGISIGGGDAGNYHLTNTTASATADITPRDLTVTATGVNKIYDGTTVATVALATDKIGGDDVSASFASASFADKHVGTAKAISVAGLSISGGHAGNYHLTNTTASTTADITPRDLTVTATGVNKAYNGTTSATVTLATNKIGGDDVSASSASASFADQQVGTGKTVSVTGISIGGGDAGNYHLTNTTASATADITPRDLTVTATGVNKAYNGTASATVTLATDKIGGDDVAASFASASFADKHVGTAKSVGVIGVSISGADASSYHLTNTTVSATADITPRDLTVTVTGVNRVYSGTASATVTLATDKIGGDDVSASFASASFADKHVGTAKTVSTTGISISGGDAGNYHLTNTTASATADITPRDLTVTATGVNKVYNGTTDATVTLSDDRVAADALTDSYASATFANKNVGNNKTVTVSGIAISGADAGNYALSSTTATTTASIAKRPLTVTAVTDSKTYDGTFASSKVPVISAGTSLAGGDTASLAERFDNKEVGTGKHMMPIAVVNDGNGGSNYDVTLVDNPTGVIGAWSLKGFYQPVTMSSGAMVYNTIKGGSTVPLKFNVYAGVGGAEQTNTSSVQSFVLQLISCTPGIDDPLDDAFTTTGGTTLRYDSAAGQFINNWQSPKVAGKCYAVTMTAQDNSTLVAYFKTK